MNILISNDDGYLAQGIAILARVASEFANVRVVAPERNRSGASNSLTLDRPLSFRAAENGFYYSFGFTHTARFQTRLSHLWYQSRCKHGR